MPSRLDPRIGFLLRVSLHFSNPMKRKCKNRIVFVEALTRLTIARLLRWSTNSQLKRNSPPQHNFNLHRKSKTNFISLLIGRKSLTNLDQVKLCVLRLWKRYGLRAEIFKWKLPLRNPSIRRVLWQQGWYGRENLVELRHRKLIVLCQDLLFRMMLSRI